MREKNFRFRFLKVQCIKQTRYSLPYIKKKSSKRQQKSSPFEVEKCVIHFIFPRITITILSSPLSPSSFHIFIRLNVSSLAQLTFYPGSRSPFTKYLGWNNMCARFDKATDTDGRSFVSLSALRASLWRLRRELLGIRIEKNLWHPGLTIQKVMVFSFRHYFMR